MTPDYERLEDVISRFKWEDSEEVCGVQLVWSSERNVIIDEDFYFDSVLRSFGNEINIDEYIGSRQLAITIGEWLYFGRKVDLEKFSTSVLLRRARWSRIEIVDVDTQNEVATITVTAN